MPAGHEHVWCLVRRMQEAQAAVEYTLRAQEEHHECLQAHVRQAEAKVQDMQALALEAAREAARVLQQVPPAGP